MPFTSEAYWLFCMYMAFGMDDTTQLRGFGEIVLNVYIERLVFQRKLYGNVLHLNIDRDGPRNSKKCIDRLHFSFSGFVPDVRMYCLSPVTQYLTIQGCF